jgi:hypothetical protein
MALSGNRVPGKVADTCSPVQVDTTVNGLQPIAGRGFPRLDLSVNRTVVKDKQKYFDFPARRA